MPDIIKLEKQKTKYKTIKLQDGMMESTGKYADGQIGAVRFIFGYYVRWLLGFVIRH